MSSQQLQRLANHVIAVGFKLLMFPLFDQFADPTRIEIYQEADPTPNLCQLLDG